MSEAPPPKGDPPNAGADASDGAAEPKKKGDSDPLFNPPNLTRRTTVMGLAPAPHLGGLSGSPGAQARAEEAARRQRVLNRLTPSERPATAKEQSATPPPLQEEIIEPLPPPFSAPPPANAPKPGSGTYVGMGPMRSDAPVGPTNKASIQDAEVEPASTRDAVPNHGQTTVLMAGNKPLTPLTPPVPLTLPRSDPSMKAELPDSAGWEIAAPPPPAVTAPQPPAQNKMPSTTVLIANPALKPGGFVGGPSAHAGPTRPIPAQRIEQVGSPAEQEKPPNTERMMRTARIPTPQESIVPQRQVPQATTALAVHDPYALPAQRHALPSTNLDNRLVLLSEPDSTRAASFRVLRDGLLGKNLPRVVAITSAAPNDGKTTCAINLALALSEQPSTTVILVDANFFEPELASVFMIDRLTPLVPPEPWLAPYKIVSITSSLHVAGIVREGGRTRFEQHRFEAMIDRLCQANYDYVIIDAPALRNAPNVASLVASADGTILTVRPGGTTGRDLRRAADQIPAKKALGIALIDSAST